MIVPQGLQTLAQVQAFVSNNETIAFTLTDRIAAYQWMTDTLIMTAAHGLIKASYSSPVSVYAIT